METPEEDELEWREIVRRAEREDFENRQHANRPFWMIRMSEVSETAGQIALILLGLFVLFIIMAALLMPYIPTP